MNDALQKLWTQLREAGAAARWALAAVAGAMFVVAGVMIYRANNPHFVVLAADLDGPTFNRAVTALSGANIRYETSMGPEPYMIQVEESRKYDALNAIHASGEFIAGSRGITSGLEGSSSVFLGQSERQQRTQKRLWEEAEMQLERINYVSKARVTVSGVQTSPLTRGGRDDRRASVVLTMRQLATPNPSETRALVGIVKGATGVPDNRITIVDQHSNVIFDGGETGSVDSLIALEDRFSRDRTGKAQSLLDRAFGPGVTVVGVNGTWREVREESISEALDPSKKPRMQRSRSTEEPQWPKSLGGPAGVAANTQEGNGALGSLDKVEAETATTTEEETAYSFGSRTTHTVAQPYQLDRLSISLVVDASLQERLQDAEALVKEVVGYDETRGDSIVSSVTEIPGIERDAEGAPVKPEPFEAPEPVDPMIQMALQYGLEIIVGLAFLVIMLRTLKSAKSSSTASSAKSGGAPGTQTKTKTVVAADGTTTVVEEPEEEVDLDALARAHVEDLLKNEPEKVSALLSRWALAEDQFAETGAR